MGLDLRVIFISILLVADFAGLFGQEGEYHGLQNEVMLHPADGFTAYTLEKGEFVYNQSPFTLPLPSWAWWGITDNITAEIDLLPLLGGLFTSPNLPVPSFNFRFKLADQKGWRPALAFETMYQHLWKEVAQSEQDNLYVSRKGNSWYNHLNMSWKLGSRTHIHFSFGATYTENVFYSNRDTTNLKEAFYPAAWTPDANISIDYRARPWVSLHATISHGTTFIYLDNIPRKQQLSYGYRIAPFYKNKYSFLRNFRAEFIGFYMYFSNVQEGISSVLPVFPYFYWQWTF